MVRKVFAVFGLVVLVGASGLVVWQWSYFERWQSFPADSPVTNLSWYHPLENVFGRSPTPIVTVRSPLVTSDTWRRIDDYAFRRNSSALLVSLRGSVIHERYWYGHEPHSLSNSMEMSHTIVALLLGIAVFERTVGGPDDPLSRYLTEWKNDARGAITLRQLLSQRSGLRFSRDSLDPYNDWRRLHFGDDVTRAVLRLPLTGRPGATFSRNPANTQLLAMVIERATGERFTDFLSKRFWKPLGATTGGVWLDKKSCARVYCCLFATARDWLRVGQLIANDGKHGDQQLVPRAWLAELQRITEPNSGYAMHLYTGTRPQIDGARLGESLLAKTIVVAGALAQRVFVVPEHQLVVVRVGESPGDWDDALILNRLLRSLIRKPTSRSSGKK